MSYSEEYYKSSKLWGVVVVIVAVLVLVLALGVTYLTTNTDLRKREATTEACAAITESDAARACIIEINDGNE